MPDALFSAVFMVDRSPIASPATVQRRGRRAAERTPGVDTLARTDQMTHSALAAALAEALVKVLPHDAAPLADTQVELSVLAAAVADIVSGRSVILRLTSDVAGYRRVAVKAFLEKVVRVSGTLETIRQEAAIAKLADVILPNDLADARGALAADNLDLRDRFVAQTSPLTSAQVAAQAGHRSSNPYATAARWKKAGDIFSVHHRGTEYFPAFQFREGRPHPTVKQALAALPARLSPWQRAIWFVSTNGWLGDRAPADILDDPDSVVAAAQREAQEVIG
jgi:hypothetical protein